jgi:hypothetical protein
MCNALQISSRLQLFVNCVFTVILERVFDIATHIRHRVDTLHYLKLKNLSLSRRIGGIAHSFLTMALGGVIR